MHEFYVGLEEIGIYYKYFIIIKNCFLKYVIIIIII